VESWRSRLPGSPVLVLGLVAAAAVFGLALLIGWVTAGTHERIGHAARVRTTPAATALPLLRRARPLPTAPPARVGKKAATPQIPRLIIGSG
jgi:hypothetical protein